MSRIARITFNSSWAQVEGIDDKTYARIKTELTYLDKNIQYQNDHTNRYYQDPNICMLKGKRFYTGLIPRVIWILNNCDYTYEIHKEHEDVEPSVAVELPDWLYDHQREILAKALDLKRGICQAPTGGGKSITMAWLVKHFPTEKIIVTVPEKSLLKQLLADLQKITGEEIGEVYGESKVFKRITVGIINSLSLLAKERPYLFRDVDVLICDECHRAGDNFYQDVCLATENADYKLGFSATAWRESKGDDLVLEGLFGPTIIKVKEQTLVDKGLLAQPVYVSVPFTSPRRTYSGYNSRTGIYNTRNGKPNRLDVYNGAIVYNTARNDYIVDLAQAYLSANTGLACLVLVQSVEHGEILSNLFGSKGLEVPFISGKSKLKDRRQTIADIQSGDLKLLIASSVFNEGQDIPRLGLGILAGGGGSEIRIVQQVGRFIRKYPNKTHGIIVDIADDEEYYLYSNFQTRKSKVTSVYQNCHIVLSTNDSLTHCKNGFTNLQTKKQFSLSSK